MKLSIIMPCYNVESTLARALDSVLMQRTTFDYEVLVVNDASTDHTATIVKEYAAKYPQVRLLENSENVGNARTFYHGLQEAQGDYFCVLDGDDYYTIPDKLQRQVDFLDRDVDGEYVATATQYILDLGGGQINVPDRSAIKEFSYVDFLTQNAGYFHTATYMYRNIFRGNIPEYFSMNLYRGDTPRTTFHLMYSGKKVRVLDFVGSAYYFDLNGIWSGLKEKEQFEYQVNYLTQHRQNVGTNFERRAIDRLIAFNQEKLRAASEEKRKYTPMSIDTCLNNIAQYAKQFAFGQNNFVLRDAFYSDYIDTLLASMGCIFQLQNVESCQRTTNLNRVAIVNGILNPHGGGIFAEINELIDIYCDQQVYLIVTEMSSVSDEICQQLAVHKNLTVLCPPSDLREGRLFWLCAQMAEIAPYRAYYYCSHADVYAQAMMQRGVCENVCLFSFDHGYLCGISNPNLDTIIAKRPVDYAMLHKKFGGERIIYIPTWNYGAVGCDALRYKPFDGHTALITASGAARFYKIDGRPPYRYIDCILATLVKTRGRHFHFGELPDEVMLEITQKLADSGLPQNSFTHITWSENIPLDLLKYKVDVFVEPFPVVSYKLTLEVLSVGVPVFAFSGIKRMSVIDFIPKGSPRWRSQAEFVEKLSALGAEGLAALSDEALAYFRSNHKVSRIKPYIRENRCFQPPAPTVYADDELHDMMSSLRLLGPNYRVRIMQTQSIDKAWPLFGNAVKTVAPQAKVTEAQDKAVVQRAEAAKCTLKDLYASVSYRVGKKIMWLPRNAKWIVVHSKGDGFANALHQLRTGNVWADRYDNPVETLKTISHSEAYIVGRAATWLPRKVRDLMRCVCHRKDY